MKVYLGTVGCRLNQAEIESMAWQFRAGGHVILPTPERADLAVLNTCSVTHKAAADSRAMIRRSAGQGAGHIIATGCWATLRQAEAAGLPGVLRVVPNASKDGLVPSLLGWADAVPEFKRTPRQPIPGARHRTRAFIKVQDGCDNHCTFCVTTIARGRARSRPLWNVITDVRDSLQGGAKEIALTGVHLGSWGADLGLSIGDLVRAILQETDAPRLRLSSLEPWDLDERFLRLWENRRLSRHLHLPLQSGCAATLNRMRRRTTPETFRGLVQAARNEMPDVAITTDVIAGFPGETEVEYRSSMDLVDEMNFAGGHAFTFSPMLHTAAARLPEQVPPDERRRRTRSYMELFDQAAVKFRARQVGSRRWVLWESSTQMASGAWRLGGLTDNYIRVQAYSTERRWNQIDPVLLVSEGGDRLHGMIVESG